MKVTCRQADLAFALNLVNRAVTPNTTLPVLNNIYIKAEGKHLYFSATNLEVAINYHIDADIFNEGAVTVPSKLITSYVSLLKDEDINIKLEEGFNLALRTNTSDTKIKGIDAIEFPTIPKIQTGDDFSLEASSLEEAINQTVFSASSNVSRPVLTGVLLHLDKNTITLVATDSYRLAEKILPLSKGPCESSDYIIPSKTISELGKILGAFDVKTVNCRVTKNQILFSVGNLHIISRLIEGTFPEYKKIIPAGAKTKVEIGVYDFILAVKKVNLFAEETNNNVKISVTNNGKLIVSTNETQIGEGSSEVDVAIEGENNQVALNAQYILDVLSHIKGDKIHFSIDNKLSPVTIKPNQKDSDYTHVIMPLKL